MNILSWDVRCYNRRLLRDKAEAARKAVHKAIADATPQMDDFFKKIDEVVYTFNHQHMDFGDKYFRLKFAYKLVDLPADFMINCAILKSECKQFAKPSEALRLAHDAEAFHAFVTDHNKILFRFAGYDGNMRALLKTIEEVHLRALGSYVNSGQVGGSPIGVNPIIKDFDNTRGDFTLKQQGFQNLATDLGRLKLD
ncbi:MAG TPA: hypothetical protein VG839_02655 [Asticcacaulis sp.]|nr:hypothetical protein [Asticcacaulis sp.]